jgi:hypothetical protein
MTRYLVAVYQPDTEPPPDLEDIMADVTAVNDELRASGSWVFAAGLHPPATATTVRAAGDELLITDGPFAEGKEYLGGFSVIEAPDLDAALAWAGKLARALRTLSVEVRPLIDDADRPCGPGPG